MKRIILFLSILVATVSCLPESNFSQSGTIVATFDYTGESYTDIFSKDSLFYDSTNKVGIGWDMLAFYHKVDKQTSEFKGGFILSGLSIPSSGETAGLSNNKYRVNSKNTGSVINAFLVYDQTDDMPEHDLEFCFTPSANSTGNCVMKACFVNNTVAVADAVVEKFVQGDKLTLKATGYLAGKETGSAEIMLAEKTTAKDSIVSTWTEFDLSKLGSIDKVDFEILMPEGRDVPKTVCIDNVIATISLTY